MSHNQEVMIKVRWLSSKETTIHPSLFRMNRRQRLLFDDPEASGRLHATSSRTNANGPRHYPNDDGAGPSNAPYPPPPPLPARQRPRNLRDTRIRVEDVVYLLNAVVPDANPACNRPLHIPDADSHEPSKGPEGSEFNIDNNDEDNNSNSDFAPVPNEKKSKPPSPQF